MSGLISVKRRRAGDSDQRYANFLFMGAVAASGKFLVNSAASTPWPHPKNYSKLQFTFSFSTKDASGHRSAKMERFLELDW
jgi:hypothetical protein